jgi:hypothetical protein
VSGTARTASPALADELSEAALHGPSSLDLELEAPISRAPAVVAKTQSAAFTDDGFELDSVRAPPLGAGLAVAPEGRANWPTGVSPARERLALDPLEIRVLADFGEAPSLGPQNAVYALRVMFRKNTLKTQLRRVEQELSAAESARDAQLAELAERLMPELSGSPAFREALRPLADVDSLAKDRGRALEATNAEQAAEISRFDEELSAIARDIASEVTARSELARGLEANEQALRRVEARQKRCFIEMRGIEQQAAQRLGPEGGEMPPDLCALLAPLKTQAAALQPELEQARAAYDASRAQDDVHARAIKAHESRKSEFERKKSQLTQRFQRQIDVRQQGLGEVTNKRQSALADLGRAVLAARGGVTVDERTLETLRGADSAVLELAKKSELHLHALDACDNDKVNSGLAWILGVAALLGAYIAYRSLSG